MVPDIKDLLPDVDSTILSGVLEIIVEVSALSLYALFHLFMPFNKISILRFSESRI
jgi:hypothetical protein